MFLAAALASLVAATGLTLPAAPPSSDVCVIRDSRAIELSGLVATATGYVTINDSNLDPARIRVFYLDRSCKVTQALGYPTAARDPEDLAVAPDGTLWVADIGDNITNEVRRQTIALWHLPADGGAPVIHRLTYPDGPHDAEALLFGGDGLPVVITKEISGVAGLYKPVSAPQPNTATGVVMTRVGEFRPRSTGVANPLGVIGELAVTGAGTSPDRHRVALRTYTAAYEWDVPDGDVVKAITAKTPRVTDLPYEAQGEAIAYTADGTQFLTVSDRTDAPVTIRQFTPSTTLLTSPTPAPSGAAAPGAPAAGSWFAGIPMWLTIGIGVGGALLMVFGFLAVRRSRRLETTA